jgi:LysM repeat protein
MRLTQFTTNESRRATNAVMLTEAKILNEWSTVGKRLVEYKLTPQQIEQIFANAEKGQTGMGGNRTMLGQGKDAVAAVNTAWEDLKTQMQNSAPVKGFDQKVNAALNKIGVGSADPEFQNNVSGWVQKYRDFAKQHPIAQGAIYAVLIALTGLSGAGIAGAAALGLLKMADRVLQGDRFTSALYKGAKTGGTAYALGQLKNHFADQPTGPAVQSPNPSEQFNDYTVAKGDTLSQIAKDNGVSVDALMKSNPEITNPDVIKAGQAIKIPLGDEFVTGNPYQGGVGTASDTMKKIASGEYTPSEISTNAAAKAAGKAASQAADTATDTAADTAADAAMNAPIPADQAPMYQADAGQYDDGASQLGQDPDMTKVADTNQGRLKMNQWRQETGSPNAKPITPDTPSDGSYSQSAPIGANGQPMRQVPMDDAGSAAASASSNTPTLSLSDTGNGIKGDLTLPDGSTVQAQAFPADGIQPRMPFGSQKVTVELNGQKVDAWVYNGKAYIKNFDTNTLNAPAPSTSTGSPFFDRMNRAAANGVKLREAEIKAVFKISANQMFKRQAINEGIWDSIKGAAGQAMDWAKTKGHNLTTKITADKLKQAWQAAGSPTDSQKVRDLLVAQGVAAQVADSALKSVSNVRAMGNKSGKSQVDRRAAAQNFGQNPQREFDFGQPTQAQQPQGATAKQAAATDMGLGDIGNVRPGDDRQQTQQSPAQAQPKASATPPSYSMKPMSYKVNMPQAQNWNMNTVKKAAVPMSEEMIAKGLSDELDAFMGREKKVDKRDISKRPQDRAVQKKVTEVSSDKLNRYMRGVSDDSQKHPKDPTKRKPEKASRSVSGFTKASNRLQKREVDEDCWDGYEQIGMKKKAGKTVPNCVPKKKK